MDMFPPWQLRLTEIQLVISFSACTQSKESMDIIPLLSFNSPRYAILNPFGWLSGKSSDESKYSLLKKETFAAALEEYSKSVAREGK
jgi:hypothetical protein